MKRGQLIRTWYLPNTSHTRCHFADTSVYPTSQVRSSPMLVFRLQEIEKNDFKVDRDIHQNPSIGSRIESCGRTDRQPATVLYALISYTKCKERIITCGSLLPEPNYNIRECRVPPLCNLLFKCSSK
jgi:hypothetical protein